MRFILLQAVLLASISTAQAVEYPKMIGTWQQVSVVGADSGTSENPLPLKFFNEVSKTPTVYIVDRNEGPLFSGKRVSGFGAKELPKISGTHSFVAAFKPDGKNFILSEDTHIGFGEVTDDTVSICAATILTTRNFVACGTYKKVK
jgi:hypothetical protein